eukprot:4086140-Alexandrium_andersonii.AAC.1
MRARLPCHSVRVRTGHIQPLGRVPARAHLRAHPEPFGKAFGPRPPQDGLGGLGQGSRLVSTTGHIPTLGQ